METVQQNGRFTLFSSKFLSIYSILCGSKTRVFSAQYKDCSIRGPGAYSGICPWGA